MNRHFEQAFPGQPDAISDVRRWVRRSLTGLIDDGSVDDAELCADELAANAVRHSQSGEPGGKFTVIAEIGEEGLQVQIVDQGGPEPMILPSVAETAEGHRGLPIIAALGALRVDGGPHGHRVSALLPLQQAAKGASAE